MVFSVGETVVYPHHGAALIEAIETRVVRGEEKLYLVLRVAQGDLTVRVPAENAEIVGVRDVVNEEGLSKVFDVLRAPHTEEPTNWSRRYKANLEKLASGNPLKVAEVVRDLWRRERERGLSAGEKRMLAKARDILVGEVALAGEPLLVHAIRNVAAAPSVGLIVIAAPPDAVDEVTELLPDTTVPVRVVPGGATRQASVASALSAVPAEFDLVLVHDAARAL